MKFSHGVWRMRDDVHPFWAARAHEHRVEGEELIVHCVDRDRKQNLNNYGIFLRVSSPLPDVIRVRVSHFTGRQPRRPSFVLESGTAPGVRIEEHAGAVVLKSGRASVRVHQDPLAVEFLRDGEIVCRTRPKSLGVMTVRGERDHVMQRFSLSNGELVYGMGERFGPLVKNGQQVSIWNEDPGTETDLAYKNVPFYLTNRGYGILVNNPGRVDFEVATERVSAVQVSVPENELDYYLFVGSGPREVLERYTALSGRPALPPGWSFGLWLSTSFLTDYDESIVGSMIDGMAERKIPLSVFHFDCLWMREHHWCDFEWDPKKFPDPGAMLTRLKQRGVKISVWINPYISEFSRLFAEGRERGYFLKTRAGDVYQRYDWQPGIALVDFTNPDAVSWYQDKLRRLLELGVDCFKTDFGERIPPDAVYFDGSDPERMHNFYPYLYNQAVFSLLEQTHKKGGAIVFARSATAGSQRFPVHWGGDCDATFESMAETLRGGLSFGLSGAGFWSHDIGGFNATATPELYKRWVAFGLLSSHSRLHGANTYRVPWEFDEESVDVLRGFVELKHRLMPELWRVGLLAHRSGLPMMRAMVLEFPDDPACGYLDRQYMLGDKLLVAPVLDAGGRVEYYLPQGIWTDFFTGERREGGRWHTRESVPFTQAVLEVREGTLLALGTAIERPDGDYLDAPDFQLFELSDGMVASTMVERGRDSARVEARAERRGSSIVLSASGDLAALQAPTVTVRGLATPARVQNGEVDALTELGVRVRWLDPSQPVTIRLS